ncbi:MAG: hypothetical protein E7269_04745 [Lachnospiraceae bacterium]|nr:hypothetical protein [Lachnospiraceae bacterium]
MQLEIKFEQSNTKIDVEFDSVNYVSDGGFERGYEQGYNKGYDEGYANGESESGGNIWQYVATVSFAGIKFPDDYELVLKLPSLTDSISSMIRGAGGLKKIKLIASVTKYAVNMWHAFSGVSTVETIDLTEFYCEKIGRFESAFASDVALSEILGQLNLTTATNLAQAFNRTVKLVTVSFVEKSIFLDISFADSPLLSTESIQSIIDGLADLTGQTAKTLTLHTEVKAKLTDEQIATITSKNWNLA